MTDVSVFTALSRNLEMSRNVIRKGNNERYLKLVIDPESKLKQNREQRELTKQSGWLPLQALR